MGCEKVLVLDGNMKNARQVCMLKQVGQLHFSGMPGSVVVGMHIIVLFPNFVVGTRFSHVM